jgi:transcriptional regulator with XRE-family HTH domain
MSGGLMNNVLGKRLRDLRIRAGWSQAELASKLDTSSTMIGRYERGLMKPSFSVVQRLADVLQVSLDHLVSEHVPQFPFRDKEMTERFRRLSNLSPNDREMILSVVDGLIRDAISRTTYRGEAG